MKKMVLFLLCVTTALVTLARPGPHGGPIHRHHGHHGPHHGWVAPAIVGGVVGGAILGGIFSKPTVQVVTPIQSVSPAPNIIYQQVWVPDQWIDQVMTNGSVTRVFIPGHYEMRAVSVR